MSPPIIIGAGIAGLTATVALRRIGLEPRNYEGSGVLAPIGAGIWMAPNASRCSIASASPAAVVIREERESA